MADVDPSIDVQVHPEVEEEDREHVQVLFGLTWMFPLFCVNLSFCDE